jgi:hypothetical protein
MVRSSLPLVPCPPCSAGILAPRARFIGKVTTVWHAASLPEGVRHKLWP